MARRRASAMKMRAPRPRILFQHVPKTAGTNLTFQLKRNYPEHEVCPIGFIHARSEAAEDPREELARAKREAFARFPLMADHLALLGEAPPDVQRISLVRDPLERALSLYKEYRTTADHHLAGLDEANRALRLACRELSFNEIFERLSGQFWFEWDFRFAQVGNALLEDRSVQDVLAADPDVVVADALARADAVDFLAETSDFDAFCGLSFGRLAFDRLLGAGRLNARELSVDYDPEPVRRALAHEYAYFDGLRKKRDRTRTYLADCAYFRSCPAEGVGFDGDGRARVNAESGGVFERLFLNGRLLAVPLQAPGEGAGGYVDLLVHAAEARPVAVWMNGRPSLSRISSGDVWRVTTHLEAGHRVHQDHVLLELVFDRPLAGFGWTVQEGPRVLGLDLAYRC